MEQMTQAPSATSKPRPWRRSFLYLEAVLAFMPLVAMLALGALLMPTWAGSLVYALLNPDMIAGQPGPGLLTIVVPMASVILGGIGVLSLARLLSLASDPLKRDRNKWITNPCSVAGVTSVVLFNAFNSNLSFTAMTEDTWEFVLLSAMPAVALMHLTFLARRQLLPACLFRKDE